MGRIRQVTETYLLDTSVLIMATHEPERLSKVHDTIIREKRSLVVSVASLWEIEIKRRLNKLAVPPNMLVELSHRAIDILDINARHAIMAGQLPLHHADPFDRMLIAQAMIEGLTVLTTDRQFARYDVALA